MDRSPNGLGREHLLDAYGVYPLPAHGDYVDSGFADGACREKLIPMTVADITPLILGGIAAISPWVTICLQRKSENARLVQQADLARDQRSYAVLDRIADDYAQFLSIAAELVSAAALDARPENTQHAAAIAQCFAKSGPVRLHLRNETSRIAMDKFLSELRSDEWDIQLAKLLKPVEIALQAELDARRETWISRKSHNRESAK